MTPGTHLGPYEILGPLGAGGMGEVYRARDTKLGRDVALKVLSPAFIADADRVARFEREARLLASLNHPHIGAIYGFEDSGEVPALVLELVEGETLEDRLSRGPLSLSDALTVAHQIADALDAAHGSGIIHRDLKPSNIKITPDGGLKVLDFGLAKAHVSGGSTPDLSKSPTMMTDGTSAGVILGTVAYMSPEQARGKAVDKRTDIWAFGCVLHQMLTGRPAFRGETVSDTIVSILEREPDWTGLPVGTPPAVRRLLQRCLEKDQARRLRDIGDVRHWMEEIATAKPGPGAAVSGPRLRGLTWMLGAVALASTILAGWLFWSQPTAAPPRNVQLHRLTDLVGMEDSPAISPDGKTVAFVARAGSKRQIFVRLLAGGAPLQITRDDVDHERPRWAPDSSSLIYYVPPASGDHGMIWEISALGGEPRRIGPALSGGDVSHDGRRIALFRVEGERIALVLIWRDGSGREQLRQMPPGNVFEYPRWSPDDRWIAGQYSGPYGGLDVRLLVVGAADGEPQDVVRGTNLKGLAWLQDGSGIVYSSSAGSTVLYPPILNLRTVQRDGSGDRQLTFGDVSYVEPDVHALGQVMASRIRMQSDVWKFPVTGSPAENTRGAVRITHQTGQARTPSVSPDESEVVYLSDSGGHGNLWVARTDGSGARQITFERDPAVSVGVPVWSPTGSDILFILTRPGAPGLSLINRDGSGLRQFTSNGVFGNWSADGQWIYYAQIKGDTACIHKAPLAGEPTTALRCDNAVAPAPARDGSALYFVKRLSLTTRAEDEIHRARPENGRLRCLAA